MNMLPTIPPARFRPLLETRARRALIVAALLCGTSAASLRAQSTTGQTNSTSQGASGSFPVLRQPVFDSGKLNGVPRDFILYRFFFAHVQSLEKFADGIQNGSVAAAIASRKPLSALPPSRANQVAVPPPLAQPISGQAAKATIADDGAKPRHQIKNGAGLADAEEALVKNTAARCMTDLAAFDKVNVPLVKAITAKYAPGATLSGQDKARIAQMSNAREQVVTDYVAQLRSAMGPQRFAVLHAFVVGSETPNIRHRDTKGARVK